MAVLEPIPLGRVTSFPPTVAVNHPGADFRPGPRQILYVRNDSAVIRAALIASRYRHADGSPHTLDVILEPGEETFVRIFTSPFTADDGFIHLSVSGELHMALLHIDHMVDLGPFAE
ncbi:hypothetical protein [Streptomyces gossypiisoli]|uniref:hypothetical protein n=1 Tax=Streptomyces gossypiisoli TaxID=2748864 RepID=UPI001E427377|nr:hypothetical protein [Streptomyces gossypiisoli]